jgi:hypothetical protein
MAVQGNLRGDLPDAITEEVWCEYDWLRLDYDAALKSAWDSFCQVIAIPGFAYLSRPRR